MVEFYRDHKGILVVKLSRFSVGVGLGFKFRVRIHGFDQPGGKLGGGWGGRNELGI